MMSNYLEDFAINEFQMNAREMELKIVSERGEKGSVNWEVIRRK